MTTATLYPLFALNEDDYLTAVRLREALEHAEDRGWTVSETARRARTDTVTAARLLPVLVADRSIHVTGAGRSRRWHPGRAT